MNFDEVTVNVAGVRIELTSRNAVLQKISNAMENDAAFCAIHTINPEILMHAHRSHEYASILNEGELNVIDGVGLSMAIKRATKLSVERICGSDLIFDLAAMAEMSNRPLLLLGGLPLRLSKAETNLKRLYPNLKTISFSPTYSNNLPLAEQMQLENLVETLRPSVVVVFLGAPRQETWISQNRKLLSKNDVRVAAGLGGTVDFLSGEIKRAPKWVRAIGFEWVFRLLREPKRLKRQLSTLPEFAIRAIFTKNFVKIQHRHQGAI